jgi:hypothetical protein
MPCRQDWTKPNKYYWPSKAKNKVKVSDRIKQAQDDQWARAYREQRSQKEARDIDRSEETIKSFYSTTGKAFWPIMNYGYPSSKLRRMDEGVRI